MNVRAEKILNHEFFIDKEDLGKQIIMFEEEGKGYLPNSFKTRVIPPSAYNYGDKPVSLGRIEHFYFFGMQTNNKWKYQAFENESKCKKFFIDMTDGEDNSSQRAFWLGQVERLAF